MEGSIILLFRVITNNVEFPSTSLLYSLWFKSSFDGIITVQHGRDMPIASCPTLTHLLAADSPQLQQPSTVYTFSAEDLMSLLSLKVYCIFQVLLAFCVLWVCHFPPKWNMSIQGKYLCSTISNTFLMFLFIEDNFYLTSILQWVIFLVSTYPLHVLCWRITCLFYTPLILYDFAWLRTSILDSATSWKRTSHKSVSSFC